MKVGTSRQVKSILWNEEVRFDRYWICPQCETENDAGSAECIVCGCGRNAIPAAKSGNDVKRKLGKVLKIAAIAVGAVVGLAILILLL